MILLCTLFLIITTGCQTVKPAAPVYPPRPERHKINLEPKTEKDYALILAYYEYLVEEWEAWADCVENK